MAFSLTDTGARFNDLLKGLQAEFELLSTSTRPSRFNVYLRRLKGEFDIMAVELDSFQKEREEYEALIEAQAKELEDLRRNAVSARGILASSHITVNKPTTSAGVKGKATDRSSQPTTLSRHTESQPTNHPGSTSIFIFNDEVEKKIDVEMVHTLSHLPSILAPALSYQRSIWCVKFSEDGKYVAAGSHDGKADIYGVKTGNFNCALSKRNNHIWSLCFGRGGQYLATAGSRDFCVYIWTIKKKEVLQTFKGHSQHITSLDFSPNGRQLVSASYDSTVRLWNNGIAKILTDDNDMVFGYYTSAVFSPDGKYIAASHSSGMLWIWEVNTGHLVRRVQAHLESANSVRFMPDGEGLVSGGTDKTLKFWDVRSLLRPAPWERVAKPERVFSGHQGVVSSLAISPDGKWIASGSDDKSVRIWDSRTAAEQCMLTTKNKVKTVDFSPAGGYLAFGGDGGTVMIWRYSDNSPAASSLDGSDLPRL